MVMIDSLTTVKLRLVLVDGLIADAEHRYEKEAT